MPALNLGPVLRQLRKEAKLGARDVSRRLGRCDSYVSRCEAGLDAPSAEIVLRLSKIYEVKPRRLLQLLRKEILRRSQERLKKEHEKLLSEWNQGRKYGQELLIFHRW